MYFNNIKIVISHLIISFVLSSTASATSTSSQTLGVSANSVDVWTFNCPNTYYAEVYVTDLLPDNPPALLQVVLGKYGYNSAQATDVIPSPSGENPTISSPYIGSGIIIIDSIVYGQSQGGDYTMVIKKTAGAQRVIELKLDVRNPQLL